jgi:hypothetical protein
LRFQRIPEEDQQVDVPLDDPCADLLVAAERAALEAGDAEVQVVTQHDSGRAGCEQAVPGQHAMVVTGPLAQVMFLVVVCDEGNTPVPALAPSAGTGRC